MGKNRRSSPTLEDPPTCMSLGPTSRDTYPSELSGNPRSPEPSSREVVTHTSLPPMHLGWLKDIADPPDKPPVHDHGLRVDVHSPGRLGVGRCRG